MSEVCVAHLVREANGLDPFATFIRSYREKSPGIAHHLLLVFKGFSGTSVPGEYQDILQGLQYRAFFFADSGFDIVPFFAAAKEFDYAYFCFLNSFSVILDQDWLAKMHRQMCRGDIGIVGASGSYESFYNDLLIRYGLDRDGIYLRQIISRDGLLTNEGRLKLRRLWTARRYYHPFPNYHIRTNAYLLPGRIARKIKVGRIDSKEDAHRFESGRNGLTRQIFAMGLKAVVVGQNGLAYEKDRWCKSETFVAGEQSNLLVQDNRTLSYLKADPASRQALSEIVWGI